MKIREIYKIQNHNVREVLLFDPRSNDRDALRRLISTADKPIKLSSSYTDEGRAFGRLLRRISPDNPVIRGFKDEKAAELAFQKLVQMRDNYFALRRLDKSVAEIDLPETPHDAPRPKLFSGLRAKFRAVAGYLLGSSKTLN